MTFTTIAGRAAAALATATLLVSLTACNGADSKGSVGTANGAASSTAAAARLKTFQQDPGKVNAGPALSAPPAPGKTVYYLVLNLPTTQSAQDGMKAAAAAAGWNLKVLLLDPTDPQGYASGIEQAVSAKADFIVAAALDAKTAGPAIDKAKAAGVPIMETYGTDPADGKANGIYVTTGGVATVNESYPAAIDWAIADSKGTANILYVTIPDITILKATDDANKAHIKEACTTCKYTPLEVTAADLGAGQVASQVVSAIQADPSIDYVFFSFTDMGIGVPAAVQSAGFDKVKFMTGSANTADMANIAKGKDLAAGTLNPQYYASWVVMDAMVHLAAGQTIDADTYAVLPPTIADRTNVPSVFPSDSEWKGPKGFEDQYKALWKVS